jgi:hypothetical protein
MYLKQIHKNPKFKELIFLKLFFSCPSEFGKEMTKKDLPLSPQDSTGRDRGDR